MTAGFIAPRYGQLACEELIQSAVIDRRYSSLVAAAGRAVSLWLLTKKLKGRLVIRRRRHCPTCRSRFRASERAGHASCSPGGSSDVFVISTLIKRILFDEHHGFALPFAIRLCLFIGFENRLRALSGI